MNMPCHRSHLWLRVKSRRCHLFNKYRRLNSCQRLDAILSLSQMRHSLQFCNVSSDPRLIGRQTFLYRISSSITLNHLYELMRLLTERPFQSIAPAPGFIILGPRSCLGYLSYACLVRRIPLHGNIPLTNTVSRESVNGRYRSLLQRCLYRCRRRTRRRRSQVQVPTPKMCNSTSQGML